MPALDLVKRHMRAISSRHDHIVAAKLWSAAIGAWLAQYSPPIATMPAGYASEAPPEPRGPAAAHHHAKRW